jgi:hypothetical protein
VRISLPYQQPPRKRLMLLKFAAPLQLQTVGHADLQLSSPPVFLFS